MWVVEGEKHTGNRTRTRGGPRTTVNGDGQLLRLGEIFDSDDDDDDRKRRRTTFCSPHKHTYTHKRHTAAQSNYSRVRPIFLRSHLISKCLPFCCCQRRISRNTNSTHSSGAPANSAVLHLVRLGAPNFILAFAAKANFLTHTGTSRTQNSSPSDTRFVMLSHFRSTSNAKLLFNMAENLDGECSHGASARRALPFAHSLAYFAHHARTPPN